MGLLSCSLLVCTLDGNLFLLSAAAFAPPTEVRDLQAPALQPHGGDHHRTVQDLVSISFQV